MSHIEHATVSPQPGKRAMPGRMASLLRWPRRRTDLTMSEPMRDEPSIVDLVALHARLRGDHPAVIFLGQGDGEDEQERITYAELARRVAGVAALLRAAGAGGATALLLYSPGIDFIVAFLACLQAGVVAVPLPLPSASDRSGDDTAVPADSGASWVLSTSRHSASLARYCGCDGVRLLATDLATPLALSTDNQRAAADPAAVAFLQYSADANGQPKRAAITHRNLAHKLSMLVQAFGAGPETVTVSWLPLCHDMGLIGSLLAALHGGGTCVLMAPLTFVQQPLRWLRAIARYRATISGAPNFAYELCAHKVDAQQLAALDLSSWRLAFCDAEPAQAGMLDRFSARFAAAGFDRAAWYPCYGLADATLRVAGAAVAPARGADLPARDDGDGACAAWVVPC